MLLNGQLIEDKQEICERMNTFFVNTSKQLSPYLPNVTDNPMKFMGPSVPNSIFLEEVLSQEIISIVSKMKNKRSKSDDDLSMFLIKDIIQVIVIPSTHIFNLSLIQGTFPKSLKVFKVLLSFKKGKKDDINNYRSI